MSKKTAADYVRDILQELADIAEFTAAGKRSLTQDVKTRKAVIRSYEVVGEIAKRLPPELREAQPQIGWGRLIGFRDFLAHHYEEVLIENLWQAVEDLPNLKAAFEALLASLDESAPE